MLNPVFNYAPGLCFNTGVRVRRQAVYNYGIYWWMRPLRFYSAPSHCDLGELCFFTTTNIFINSLIRDDRSVQKKCIGLWGSLRSSNLWLVKISGWVFQWMHHILHFGEDSKRLHQQVRFQSCRSFFCCFNGLIQNEQCEIVQRMFFEFQFFVFVYGHGRRLRVKDRVLFKIYLGIALMVRGSCPMVPFRDHSAIPK